MKLLNVKNEAEQVEWREGRYLILSIFCFALCWKVLKKYKYLWKDRFNFSSWSLKNTPIATPLHPAYGFSKPKDNRTSWKPKCLSLLKKKKKKTEMIRKWTFWSVSSSFQLSVSQTKRNPRLILLFVSLLNAKILWVHVNEAGANS